MITKPNMPSRCAQIYYKTILYKRIEMKNRTAARLVRTEITAAAAEGELQALKDMDTEFNIKMRYRFYATLDERTCPVCGELDLQDFDPADAKEGENKPPMHPNCRCVIQPAMDGETKEEIVRRGRDEAGKGKVMPAGMSYKEWKEEYGKGPTSKPILIKNELRGEAPEHSSPKSEKTIMTQEQKDEINKVSMAIFGVEITNIENADPELLKDSMINVQRLLSEEPALRNSVSYIGVEELDPNTNAHTGLYRDDKGEIKIGIALNSLSFSDREGMVKHAEEADEKAMEKYGRPYYVEGTTPETTIVHESEHVLTLLAAMQANNGFVDMSDEEILFATDNFVDDLVTQATKNVFPEVDTDDPDAFNIAKNSISVYAGSDGNNYEAIAESRRDKFINSDDAKPLSKEIYKLRQQALRVR